MRERLNSRTSPFETNTSYFYWGFWKGEQQVWFLCNLRTAQLLKDTLVLMFHYVVLTLWARAAASLRMVSDPYSCRDDPRAIRMVSSISAWAILMKKEWLEDELSEKNSGNLSWSYDSQFLNGSAGDVLVKGRFRCSVGVCTTTASSWFITASVKSSIMKISNLFLPSPRSIFW